MQNSFVSAVTYVFACLFCLSEDVNKWEKRLKGENHQVICKITCCALECHGSHCAGNWPSPLSLSWFTILVRKQILRTISQLLLTQVFILSQSLQEILPQALPAYNVSGSNQVKGHKSILQQPKAKGTGECLGGPRKPRASRSTLYIIAMRFDPQNNGIF